MRRVVRHILMVLCAITDTVHLHAAPVEREPMLNFGRPCQHPLTDQQPKAFKSARYLPDQPLGQPVYPPFALRSGQEGTVLLSLYVTDEGLIDEVRVTRSSGWPLLDNAAMESVRNWRLQPGEQSGRPVCSWVQVPIVFKLEPYSREELAAAQVTPEARAVAAILLGENAIEELLKKAGAREAALAEFAQRLFAALKDQPVWNDALQELAAMLAIEMTPAELTAIQHYFATPEMQKFMGVLPKFNRSLQRQQQRLSTVAYCVGATIGTSVVDSVTFEFATREMQKRLLHAMPRLVHDLQPYCQCIAEQAAMNLRDDSTRARCGTPPPLEW